MKQQFMNLIRISSESCLCFKNEHDLWVSNASHQTDYWLMISTYFQNLHTIVILNLFVLNILFVSGLSFNFNFIRWNFFICIKFLKINFTLRNKKKRIKQYFASIWMHNTYKIFENSICKVAEPFKQNSLI